MTREAYEKLRNDTVDRHVAELRDMASEGEITDDDHNRVGCMVRDHIADLLEMSDAAWTTFKRIIQESREVRALNPDAP